MVRNTWESGNENVFILHTNFSTLGWKWKENYKIFYASLFLITSKFRYFTCANSSAGKSIREVRKVRKDQAYERVNKMETKKAEI